VELVEELLLVPRKETAVYFRGRGLRDDIDLVASPENCRIYRIPQRCADNTGHCADFTERLSRIVRDKFNVECRADTLEEGLDGRDEPGRPLVPAQPADR